MNIAELLEIEEGYSETAYFCSESYPTIGIGSKIGPKGSSLRYYEFKVSRKVAAAMLEDELTDIKLELYKHDWFSLLNNERRMILISMAYQLGIAGLFKFKNMIAAIETHNFTLASHEALDSRWHKQTPERAERHARVLLGETMKYVYKDM